MRKHFLDYDFFSGSSNWKECLSIFKSLMTLSPLQNGAHIRQYEKLVATYHNSDSAFSFASGRMALYAILEAMEIGTADEVILPAFTCVVCPNAIIYAGAIPIYVDIDPTTFNLDPKQIEQKITKKTKAIMVQHTFGLPADMDEILKISEKYSIPIIEDCAHALGAEYKGKKVGSFGKAAFFSSDHTKIISTSTGGVALTNAASLTRKLKLIHENSPFLPKITILRILSTFIMENFLWNPKITFIGRWIAIVLWKTLFFFFSDEGKITLPQKYPYPARLSNLQSKIGILQMLNLEKNLSHRRRIAKEYDHIFNFYPAQFEKNSPAKINAFLRYSFLVEAPTELKEKYSQYLHLGDWFTSVTHGRSTELEKVCYVLGSCPNAEFVVKHIVNLPTHQKITDLRILLAIATEIKETGKVILPGEIPKPRSKFRRA